MSGVLSGGRETAKAAARKRTGTGMRLKTTNPPKFQALSVEKGARHARRRCMGGPKRAKKRPAGFSGRVL